MTRGARQFFFLSFWMFFGGLACFAPIKRADFLRESGRTEEAFQLLQKKTQAKPEDPALQVALATTALSIGDFAVAKQSAEKAVLLRADSPEIQLLFAEVSLWHDEVYIASLAIKTAMQLGKSPSKSLLAQFARRAPRGIRRLLFEEKVVQATDVMLLLHLLTPELSPKRLFALVLAKRADLYVREGNLMLAIDDYLLAVSYEAAKDAESTYLEVGTLFLRLANVSRAKQSFAKAQEQVNASPSEKRQLAEEILKRYAEWGEYFEAALLLETLAKKGGETAPKDWFRAGTFFWRASEEEKAEQAFSRFLDTYRDRGIAASDVASFYRKQGNEEGMVRYYRQFILEKPYQFRLRETICNVFVKQGKFELVEKEFTSYIKALEVYDPSLLARAYSNIAQWYERNAKDEEAAKAYELSIQKGRKQNRLKLAEVYGRLKRYSKVKTLLDEYVETASDKRAARILTAQKFLAIGEIAQALLQAKEVFKKNPGHKDIAFLLADILFADSALDVEEKTLKTYAAANRSPENAWLDIGKRYARRGDYQRAENAFLTSFRLGKLSAAIQLGGLYLDGGDKEKAWKIFWRYIEDSTDRYSALNTVLYQYKGAGDHYERIKLREEQILLRPQVSATYLSLGKEFLQINEVQRAMKIFEQYIDISHDRSEAWKVIGDTFKASKQLVLAEESYQKALSFYPETKEGLEARASLLLELRQYSEAAKVFQAYLELPGRNSPDIISNMAERFRTKGVYDFALKFFEESLSREGEQKFVLLRLGESALALGLLEKAEHAFSLYLGPERHISSILDVASLYKKFKYFSEAIPYFYDALPLFVERNQLFTDLVFCLQKTGRSQEVSALITDLLALAKSKDEVYRAHIAAAGAYQKLGQEREHIYHLERAAMLPRSSVKGLYEKIAASFVSLGEYDSAKDYLVRAAKLSNFPQRTLLDTIKKLSLRGLWIKQSWFPMFSSSEERKVSLLFLRALYHAAAKEEGPLKEQAMIQAALVLFPLQHPKEAWRELQSIAAQSSSPAIVWEEIGKRLEEIPAPSLAFQAYENALQEDPTPRLLTLSFAKLLLKQNNLPRARHLLDSYLERFPNIEKNLLEVANIYGSLGATKEALPLYRLALRAKDPSVSSRAFEDASFMLRRTKDKEGLLALAQEFQIRAGANSPAVLLQIGRAFQKADLIEESKAQFLAILDLNPKHITFQIQAATSLVRLGETEKAYPALLALTGRTENPRQLARALLEEGIKTKTTLSFSLLKEASRRMPNRADFWKTSGDVLLKNGQISDAVWAFSQSIAFADYREKQAKLISESFMRNGAYEEAKPFIDTMTEPAEKLWIEAQVLLAKNDKIAASKALSQYIAKTPLAESVRKASSLALQFSQPQLAQKLLEENLSNIGAVQNDRDFSALVGLWVVSAIRSGQTDETIAEKAVLFSMDRTVLERKIIVKTLLQKGLGNITLPLAKTLFSSAPHDLQNLEMLLQSLVSSSPKGDLKQEILPLVQSAIKARPKEEASFVLQFAADTFVRFAQFSLAETFYEEGLLKTPDSIDIALRLGKVRLAQNDLAGAQKAFAVARENAIELAPVLSEIAYHYWQMSYLSPAMAAYKELAQLEGTFGQKFYYLASTYLLQNNISKALAVFQKGVSRSINPPASAAYYATLLLGYHQTDEAIEAALSLVKPFSDSRGYKKVSDLIRLIRKENDVLPAWEEFTTQQLLVLDEDIQKRILESVKDNSKLSFDWMMGYEKGKFAQLAINLGSPEIAVSLLSSLHRETPGNIQILTGLAIAFFESGNPKKARALLSSVTSPETVFAEVYLGIQENHTDIAQKIRVLMSVSPKMAQVAYLLRIEKVLQQGNREEAKVLHQRMYQAAVAGGMTLDKFLLAQNLLQPQQTISLRNVLFFDEFLPKSILQQLKKGKEISLPTLWSVF